MKVKAFTLLELIIVIIIVGVLTSLALPRLFSVVEYAKSAEALTHLSTIRQSFERCYLTTGNYDHCWFPNLDVDYEMNWTKAAANGDTFVYGRPAGYSNEKRFALIACLVRNGSSSCGDSIHLFCDGEKIVTCGSGVFEPLGSCLGFLGPPNP